MAYKKAWEGVIFLSPPLPLSAFPYSPHLCRFFLRFKHIRVLDTLKAVGFLLVLMNVYVRSRLDIAGTLQSPPTKHAVPHLLPPDTHPSFIITSHIRTPPRLDVAHESAS
jgi:hypothetical protein